MPPRLLVFATYVWTIQTQVVQMSDRNFGDRSIRARRAAATKRNSGDGRLAVEDLFDLGGEEILAER